MGKLKDYFKAWFNVFCKKEVEVEEEPKEIKMSYSWDDIVQVMKLYDIPEDKIIIGKDIYEVIYDDKGVKKNLTIEYPITFDGKEMKFVHHRDIEHNIRLGKKNVTHIFSVLDTAVWCTRFDLEKILELNLNVNKKSSK